jgi:hypothetical protein
MFCDLAAVFFRGSTRATSQIKPRLRHREEARLVGDVPTSIRKHEAGSGEPPIFVFLTHGGLIPSFRIKYCAATLKPKLRSVPVENWEYRRFSRRWS